ncbi:hypothetical protein [Roseateles sp. LKC17W]|uniref:Ferritin-like domain-containing protein n=1 Tax=Pelomonas margarita TaxID=3299031 RepID=A0ABW7FIG3_9BURK
MNALEKLVDEALEAELDAIAAYRRHLHSGGAWTYADVEKLGHLRTAKDSAHERTRTLLDELIELKRPSR